MFCRKILQMLTVLAAAVLLQTPNTLTPVEKNSGWKLLFDGKSTKGWHNFKGKGVSDGWAVKDGTLTIVDAGKAGDIVSDEKYQWFELSLDFNIGKGQNSGVMFHVADDGEAIWHSGPEVQIYDDGGSQGAEKTGWLYQLYQSKVDATNPPGQWNTMRILISKDKCQTDINGVKYYDFVLNSEDFKQRVAKSKFSEFPKFGTVGKGRIGIQGDHGNVSFRNIKIRPIEAQ